MKTGIFLLYTLILSASTSSAQSISREKISEMVSKCDVHPLLLRDRAGKVAWLSPDQLQTLIEKTVPIEKPSVPNLKLTGQVSINIMINTKGDVICMWGGAGHPVMLSPAFKAVHEWRFKPLSSDGKPAEYVGTIKVRVESAD